MRLSALVGLLFSLVAVTALNVHPRYAINGKCTDKDGESGVCIGKTSCSDDGASWVNNTSPGTPEDIKCCTKASCQMAERTGAGKREPDTNVGKEILKKAMEAKGKEYRWGGGSCKGPLEKYYDCSGLVTWAVYQVTKRNLCDEGLRNTKAMYCASAKNLRYKKIKFADRRVGDAVFFGPTCSCKSDDDQSIHHVGLMMNSKYKMWNSPKTGDVVGEADFKNYRGDMKACPLVIRFD
ncbi:hypothetical protein N0V94_006852 [Neodidymelliopsis sp. IMI 364377]|nr:hypothetical protein N0V94_006852 [Neodidymelliopsis sp. IMI 364377]